MRRSLASLAVAATLATPALAGAPLLEATPAKAPGASVVVRGAAFQCDGTTCRTRSAASRPLVLCQRFVREAGPVARFSVDGVALVEQELAACNAKAR